MSKKIVPELQYVSKEEVAGLGIKPGVNSGNALYVALAHSMYRYSFMKDEEKKMILLYDFQEVTMDSDVSVLDDIDVMNIYRQLPTDPMNVFLSQKGEKYNHFPKMVMFGDNFRTPAASYHKPGEVRMNSLHRYDIYLCDVPSGLEIHRRDLFQYLLNNKSTFGIEALVMAIDYERPPVVEDPIDYGKTEK